MTSERARAWGIDPGFQDYKGEWHDTSEETERALLEVMEAESDAPPEGNVVVVRGGDALQLKGTHQVLLEDGGRATVTGGEPVTLPSGYHSLETDDGERSLIVSPGRCYLPDDLDVWGWGVQLYAVHSESSWGIGDLGDLARLAEWARGTGAGMMLLNPLTAAAPGQASPYFPSSRCFRNPIYLDVEQAAAVLDIRLPEHVEPGRALTKAPLVDREAVWAAKLDALEELWSKARSSRRFQRYRDDAGQALTDFATYMTVAEEFGWVTGEWPEGYESPNGDELSRWREERADRIRFHEWLQWLAEEQLSLADEGLDLVHDLPIGVDAGGADAWLWHGAFAHGVRTGAPPDEFAAGGQDWGMPPFDPWKLRAMDYKPFIQTIRAGLASGAGLRVDHVMGLFRLWWIPAGAEASEGAYVRYPKDDLLNILALESERAGSYVIGEDLGTVEPIVREEMHERRMLSYRVMWFEPGPPEEYPEQALAAVTNHDLPTIAGLWTGADEREQRSIGLEVDADSEETLRDRLRKTMKASEGEAIEEIVVKTYEALGRAPSMVKVATLEDALVVEARPNQPGTLDERPNWSMRLPLSIEDLQATPLPERIGGALSD